jgi:monoamine oxidase
MAEEEMPSELDRQTPEEEQELLGPGQMEGLKAAPVPEDVVATAEEGLERIPQVPKRVIVIGAGMAGLVAAYELLRQGHEPLILEAQNRVGGRVYTQRSFAPGLYAEAGAMRIPHVHNLTLEYCKTFGLDLRPFVMGNPNTYVYMGGVKMRTDEAEREPGRLPYEVAPPDRGRGADALWQEAIAPMKELIEREGWDLAWEQIVRDYDQYSIEEFLEARGFSEGAIEMWANLNFVEADLNTAFIEQLREDLGKFYEDMFEIVGGTDLLARAFFPSLQEHIRFGAEVKAIDQDDHSVTVHYRTRTGRYSVTGDYAVCTVPFSVLRNIEAMKPFSRAKQKAIRQLNYSASTKILFQCRRRFWEDEGIVGGSTTTDLPVRRVVYPSFSDETTPRGMLLASYTWGQDALRWQAMDDRSRLGEALEDVAAIHPEVRDAFEVGASHAWYEDRWARGAFALFNPEQQSELQESIVSPEGRVYFAGEHCSLYHAWIQGALESGILAAREIHEAPVAMAAVRDK